MNTRSLMVTLVLVLVLTAVSAHAQGIYVPPPTTSTCWYYWDVVGDHAVAYDYSNQQYTLYVFSQSEYSAWSSGSGAYAIAEYTVSPGEMYAFELPEDAYVIVVYPVPCGVQVPPVVMYMGKGYPVGVTSLGSVSTKQVLGYFSITSISAYNPIGESQFNVPNSGADLQLNVFLVLKLSDGSVQYYWLQNVLDFITDTDQYNLVDNVWNVTTPTAQISSSAITGSGSVGISSSGGYYGFETQNYTYTLPIAGYLLINLTSTNPPMIQFCYAIVQQGSTYYPPSFNCYDTVTIYPSAPVVSASLEAMPNIATSISTPVDAELVFTGYGNYEYTTFNSLSADLELLYWSGGEWLPFPNLYSLGMTTAEASTDLTSSVAPSGFVYVTTGQLPQGNVFLAQYVAKPPLPMTYVQCFNTATFTSKSLYIYSPYTYTAPPVIYPEEGVEYVFTGMTVNGQTVTTNTITIQPSNTFATYNIEVNYETYYLVTVDSPVPVTVSTYNETVTAASFSEWVLPGSVVKVYVPEYYYFSNETMVQYLGSNETVVVNNPTSITIPTGSFEKYYLVSIISQYPVNLNGTMVTKASFWVGDGDVLSIAPKTIFTNGVFMNEPGYEFTVNKPTMLVITWNINWAYTGTMYGAVAIISIAVAVAITRRRT